MSMISDAAENTAIDNEKLNCILNFQTEKYSQTATTADEGDGKTINRNGNL